MIGVCTYWNNVRAFGFITHEGEQIFLHIKNFEKGKTPVLGSYIYFEMGAAVSQDKKPQAISARPANLQELKMSHVRGAVVMAVKP